jgi:hypothetical protein
MRFKTQVFTAISFLIGIFIVSMVAFRSSDKMSDLINDAINSSEPSELIVLTYEHLMLKDGFSVITVFNTGTCVLKDPIAGVKTSHIPRAELLALLRKFHKNDYFQIAAELNGEKITGYGTDGGNAALTVNLAAKNYSIYSYLVDNVPSEDPKAKYAKRVSSCIKLVEQLFANEQSLIN